MTEALHPGPHDVGPAVPGPRSVPACAPGAGPPPPGLRRQQLPGALAGCLVLLALVTRFAAGQVHGLAWDRDVLRFLVHQRGDLSVTLFRAVSHLGDPLVLLVLAVVAGIVLARRVSVAEAAAPAIALLAAAVTETVAKQVFDRPRPPVVFHLLAEFDPSFPSGHTTGTAALAMTVALVLAPILRSRAARITLIAVAGLLAAVVGLSRLVLGVHWLSDVVAGWLLGSSWAIAVVLMVPVVPARFRKAPALRSSVAPRAAAARTSLVGAE